MVVRFFEFFLWLLWILTSSEARTTHSRTIQGFCFLFSCILPLRSVNVFYSGV